MQGFARWLIDRDLLALLRMSFAHRPCPERGPAADGVEGAIVSEQYWVLIPPVRAVAAVGEPYWVLLRLVDRDDLLLPPPRAGVEGRNTARVGPVSVVSSIGADDRTLDGSGEGTAKELYWSQIPPSDPDQYFLEDIREYLDGSLVATLGNAAPYDPVAHPSGTINAMVIVPALSCTFPVLIVASSTRDVV
jgi:hypothetical protein